jgi:uncharacterized membrane protein YkvA (DUF1232 family)
MLPGSGRLCSDKPLLSVGMFERLSQENLRIGLLVAAVVYFIFPWDLIPDFLGLPGRVDDAGFLVFLVWVDRQHAQRLAKSRARTSGANSSETHQERARTSRGPAPRRDGSADSYAVLGIESSASAKQIRSAYLARMKEYHPDKVAHLGGDLQELAHQKTQQIQRAYDQLSR